MQQPWVFLTGGSRGIGNGIVRLLAGRGYQVAFTYAQASSEANALCTELNTSSLAVSAHQCDVRDGQAISNLAKELMDSLGAPAGVIHNAGITRDGLLVNMSLDDWDAVITTNLTGAFHVAKAFVPTLMEERMGSLVFMSSISGIRGNIGQCNYSASKAGLLGFMRSLSHEVARFKVRVNAVLPGLIETDMVDAIPSQEKSVLLKGIPLRRFGRIDEVAELAAFLIDAKSSYITGQEFVLDGGKTA